MRLLSLLKGGQESGASRYVFFRQSPYDTLGSRAKALLDHPDEAVRDFAAETAETVEEIRIFDCSEDSYGYVFYLMQR